MRRRGAGTDVVREGDSSGDSAAPKKLRVAFVHLDLGLGGAEQLVVQAAVGLVRHGHDVTMYTSHHNVDRCFPETKDGTLKVVVFGDFLPRTFLGRFTALCSLLRMVWICLCLLLKGERFDVVFNDQVSAVNPLCRMLTPKLLFYCHFPDLLLCTKRSGFLKNLYRRLLDWWEELTTGMCSQVLVNSEFTRTVFYKTFKSLTDVETQVLYPPVDTQPLLKESERAQDRSQWRTFEEYTSQAQFKALVDDGSPFFLSLNRYERKKNIGLCIDAFAQLKKGTAKDNQKAVLVIAGGYDPRVAENVEHYEELRSRAEAAGVETSTVFLCSISSALRVLLMESAIAVLYTPENEHFGIVPIEAMALKVPVIACASGGPMESVEDSVTGILCSGDKPSNYSTEVMPMFEQASLTKKFAEAMQELLLLYTTDREAWAKMGTAGRDRVQRIFSLDRFAARLESLIAALS
eukprot:gnl/TRDRNA2_/TRDRNA2_188555_c0_seq1.p1 gnl/TRDRNA2_/TRDRNA2_188555_c0~~gnl/TRDRNA2_/TRDRNA2_188555_c0_seq1.p1  ORF type:complete len:462 (-),score=90.00 gnl/TRDRNA2_/TRDRNA2_188555_c0_seq1:35-1420(-)